MFNDFIIQDNYSLLTSTFNFEKNGKVKSIYNFIRGGQIYLTSCQVKIHGGIIQNSHNILNRTVNVAAEEEEEINSKIGNSDAGGGIYFTNCKNTEINNLKIENCNSRFGGAIYLYNSTMKIANSELNNNKAEGFGGGIYSANNNCQLELYNSKITYNSTKDGSGGGIYAYGNLIIDGENTLISNNEAGTYGGGIITKTHCLIKNCVICNNKAILYSGGGLCIDGTLLLEKAKIYLNSCKQRGGGIYYNSSPKFIYDKNKIDTMVYDNTAVINGNNFYHEIN